MMTLRQAHMLAAALVACCFVTVGAGCTTETSVVASSVVVQVGRRPVTVHFPPSYDPRNPAPLVLVLHEYGGTGAKLDASYLSVSSESARRGFLYATPDGTEDHDHSEFWNATDACCDYFRSGIDDSGYLNAVIESIERHFTVDSKRVYVFGVSNGAFMAYRMACDHSDKIAAIVSVSGAMWNDPTRCNPAHPVGILEIHGTLDTTVFYRGGDLSSVLDLKPTPAPGMPRVYPGAEQTVADWAALDGCAPVADTTRPPLNIDPTPGADTTVLRYAAGCRGHVRVELWSIRGGGHLPAISAQFLPAVFDFLYAHTSGQ